MISFYHRNQVTDGQDEDKNKQYRQPGNDIVLVGKHEDVPAGPKPTDK